MGLFSLAVPSLFLSVESPAPGPEISVLSGGAIEPGMRAAAAEFEKLTGLRVSITFNTAPQMRARIAAGEVFDVAAAPPALIAEFVKAGKVQAGGLNLGQVGSGVAVRPGAPVPEIATAADIKKVVLEADSIVFNLASTGIYFENLLKKLGVWEQVEPKTTRYATGEEVMQHTLNGRGKEVAFGPITEILLSREHGLIFVGPLPPEIQHYTSYTAVVMGAGAGQDEAQSLVDFLGGPEGKRLFEAAGIE
jgi:molybdate transport system substrate-binding protein